MITREGKGVLVINVVRILLAVLTTFSLSGCSSIQLLESWKDPGTSAKKHTKLLVVGLGSKEQNRQLFEEIFVSELMKRGKTGVASYTITGSAGKPSRDSLEEAIKKTGVDGVITTRLVDIKSEKDVRTGFVKTAQGYTYRNFARSDIYPANFLDFYGTTVSYSVFEHKPVEIVSSTKAIIETNLFDAKTGSLIWSGISSAVNPEGAVRVSRDIADNAIRALVREDLF